MAFVEARCFFDETVLLDDAFGAGAFAHVRPVGAVTFSEVTSPESFAAQTTWITPFGVGTSPDADRTPPGCGVTVNVAKPGEVACTPSTWWVSAGAAPVDHP